MLTLVVLLHPWTPMDKDGAVHVPTVWNQEEWGGIYQPNYAKRTLEVRTETNPDSTVSKSGATNKNSVTTFVSFKGLGAVYGTILHIFDDRLAIRQSWLLYFMVPVRISWFVSDWSYINASEYDCLFIRSVSEWMGKVSLADSGKVSKSRFNSLLLVRLFSLFLWWVSYLKQG